MDETCEMIWGGHGCDLPKSNHNLHKCGSDVGDRCSEYDDENKRVRYMLYTQNDLGEYEEQEWSVWHPCDYATDLIDIPMFKE